MLVLTRRVNEVIVCVDQETGRRIEIMVIDNTPGRMRIGINADKEVTIFRKELESK